MFMSRPTELLEYFRFITINIGLGHDSDYDYDCDTELRREPVHPFNYIHIIKN